MRSLIPIALAASFSTPLAHAQDTAVWRGCGTFEEFRIGLLGTEDLGDAAATKDCGVPKTPEDLAAGCTHVMETSSDNKVLGDADYNRALARLVLGDLDGAIADVNHLLPSDDDSDAYGLRGVARYCAGDLDGALADFNAALAVWPDNEVALADRARVFMAMNDPARALVDAERAADLEPEHETAFAILGAAAERLGDLKKALDAYDNALEIESFCDCGAIDFDAVDAAYDRVNAVAK